MINLFIVIINDILVKNYFYGFLNCYEFLNMSFNIFFYNRMNEYRVL